jgi:ubiquinone/menaquinone biosynthesis C-methylase UbiE
MFLIGVILMSFRDRIEFIGISFMHDTMYGLFMDAEKLLLPAGVSEGQKVLEVGCGPGFFTIPAAEIVGENGTIFAIDINPFAIRKVKKKIRKKNATNVKPMLADVSSTGLESQSIDLAFFFGVIHNLMTILDKVLNEMDRILTKKGIIVIQKSRKKKEDIVEAIEENGLFTFLEEKERVLIFKKKNDS